MFLHCLVLELLYTIHFRGELYWFGLVCCFFFYFVFCFLKWCYNFWKMPLVGKPRICTFPTGECGKYMAEWWLLWVPVTWASSMLSLAWFVLWGDISQEQTGNLGPAPRTCSGAKCQEVGGLDSPRQICAVLHECRPGESCCLVSTQHR